MIFNQPSREQSVQQSGSVADRILRSGSSQSISPVDRVEWTCGGARHTGLPVFIQWVNCDGAAAIRWKSASNAMQQNGLTRSDRS